MCPYLKIIIQDNVFGEETEALVRALNEEKTPYYLLDRPIKIEPHQRYMLHGSIEFVESMQRMNPDHPKWMNIENYQYSFYAGQIKPLLNNDYIICSWETLVNNKEVVFNSIDGDKFFIRPNSGRKIFTGTTLTKKWWDKELEIIQDLPSSTDLKQDTIVIVAPYKEIMAEYRLLMHKNHVIDWSRYAGEEQFDEELIPLILYRLDYYPDEYYTLDIAATSSEYSILEINSFVSAGWYDINYNKLIRYLNEHFRS